MDVMQETDPETTDSCWSFVISTVFAFSVNRVSLLSFALFSSVLQ